MIVSHNTYTNQNCINKRDLSAPFASDATVRGTLLPRTIPDSKISQVPRVDDAGLSMVSSIINREANRSALFANNTLLGKKGRNISNTQEFVLYTRKGQTIHNTT